MPREFVYLRDVAPSILQDIRYFGEHNFLGRQVAGYEAGECIVTRRAARRLQKVQARIAAKGLTLKVYDCYRPKRAVSDFVAWAQDLTDRTTKAEFYPTIAKSELFQRKYIAKRSRHSRGSTVDVTLVALPPAAEPAYQAGAPQAACHLPATERSADNSLDFGTGYDCFHALSHTGNPAITGKAKANRSLLVAEMQRAGFTNYHREWWHFELRDEPFRKTYFDFPIRPRAAIAAPVPKPRLKVICADNQAGVSVHDGPSIGHRVTATLPADAWGLTVSACEGDVSLGAWRALDPLGKKSVRPPWCRIAVPSADPAAPLVQGWINGRYLTVVGDEAPAACF